MDNFVTPYAFIHTIHRYSQYKIYHMLVYKLFYILGSVNDEVHAIDDRAFHVTPMLAFNRKVDYIFQEVWGLDRVISKLLYHLLFTF